MPPKKKPKLKNQNLNIFKCGNPLCQKTFTQQRGLTRHLSGPNNPCGKVIKSFQHFQDSKPPAIDRTKLIGIYPKDHLSITDHTNQILIISIGLILTIHHLLCLLLLKTKIIITTIMMIKTIQ